MTPTVADEIDRYLRTGDTDPHHSAWTGDSFLACAQRASEDLRGALVAEVRRRSGGVVIRPLPSADACIALTRQKSEPMVRGLFSRAEQDQVLALVERSVVFLTPDTVEHALREERFDHDAWTVANLYLNSVGAPLLGPDAPRLLGISQETTCYVTPGYFDEDDPFADFVVHEVAHLFHNGRREQVGHRSAGAGIGCSTSPSTSARPSPTPARRSPASSSAHAARRTGSSSPPSSAATSAAATSGWTPPRSWTSCATPPPVATGGR